MVPEGGGAAGGRRSIFKVSVGDRGGGTLVYHVDAIGVCEMWGGRGGAEAVFWRALEVK